MKINDRVNHSKYGTGTIIKIMWEDTKRELFIVRFDVSNSRLHDCFGLTEDNHGYCCVASELEVV